MKYTKAFIKQQIDRDVALNPNKASLSVVLKTSEPRRVFVLFYDIKAKRINIVLERIGRTNGHPTDLQAVLNSDMPE